MKARTPISFLLAFSLVLPMQSLAANYVSFKFTAEVNLIDDPNNDLDGAIGIEDTCTGTFTYDLDAIDEDPSGEWGTYIDTSGLSGISASCNGLSFPTDPNNTSFPFVTGVLNSGLDWAHTYSPCLFPFPVDPGQNINGIILDDHTGTALSSDARPASYNLDDWDERYFVLYWQSGVDSAEIDAELLSLDRCPDNETALCSNGIDDDCDGLIDGDDPDCTTPPCAGSAASTVGVSPVYSASYLGKQLAYFMFPLGAMIWLMIWRRKK